MQKFIFVSRVMLLYHARSGVSMYAPQPNFKKMCSVTIDIKYLNFLTPIFYLEKMQLFAKILNRIIDIPPNR